VHVFFKNIFDTAIIYGLVWCRKIWNLYSSI